MKVRGHKPGMACEMKTLIALVLSYDISSDVLKWTRTIS